MTNWKCRFGFHDWRHLDSVEVAPGAVTSNGRVTSIILARTHHFRECKRCGGWQQYYPDEPGLNIGFRVHPAPQGWTP